VPGIRQWLEQQGLAQYADAFERNDIELDLLSSLSEGELQGLGLSLGHRKRLMLALRDPAMQMGSVAAPAQLSAPPTESLTSQGERRQVTVLFCDLVGSTALSNTRDPEEYRAILARYHETAISAIQRYDGFVAQIQGDGVVAYFGYPLAHEGEAERAIRAGLSVIERLAQLEDDLPDLLRVRIGIASGVVVVSHVLAPDKSAVGETPNLAARLQTLAQPGEVIISERTRVLAGGAFDYLDCGVHALKGIGEPTRVWKILGQSDAQSRFDAATRGQLTPMVGRDQEIGLLIDRWELARAGEGQVVLLQGPPGIGKSRMLRAVHERLGASIEATLAYQCSPFYSNSAFYPLAEHLERALGFTREDSPEQKLDKLERRFIGELGCTRTDCNLLARALSIPCEARYGALEMSPQRQKDETVRVFIDAVARIASAQACALLFEDAHWADPSTLEALSALVDRAETLPLLVMITYRPEFQPPWLSRAHVTPIALTRLSRAQGASIVLRVANNKPLPADLVAQIVDKTDGVPLFLEELAKAVLESNMVHELPDRYEYSGKLEKLAIPSTLRDSLMARLDRLLPVKEIAQIGAVLGREFSYELVHALSPMSEAQLTEALDKLVGSELVFRRGTPPNATYIFKHALVQDAAYESLLKGKRQALHAQIAQVIEQRLPSKADSEPELIAHHYTEAGMAQTAIPYWQKAGELAQKHVALQEAIQHYERGLALTLALPPSPTRERFELQLRTLLAMTWIGLYGYTHPQVLAHLEPASKLSGASDSGDYTLRLLWGMWVYLHCIGKMHEALTWARRLLDIGEQRNDVSFQLAGNWAWANSCYFLARFEESIEHCNRILAIYDPVRDAHIADLINHDPKTIALMYRAISRQHLGFVDQAKEDALAAIAHSRSRGHAFDLSWALWFAIVFVAACRREADWMGTMVSELAALARDQRLVFFEIVVEPTSRAKLLLLRGQPREALAVCEEAVPKYVRSGLEAGVCHMMTIYVESALACGDLDRACELMAGTLPRQSDERNWHPEALRQKALMHAARVEHELAQRAFDDALDEARRQHARFWELRITRDYARFLCHGGRAQEAKALLAPVYAQFSEGLDTPDLQEAAALLATLTG
jgi:class 3 adenylate cyclase/tetratricopeptide (TPR) repeat protein